MKNKHSNKVVPMLSPKKFIETKARSLPIYECYVNDDWEDSKVANVIVMRRHANQKITAGIYLVDLLCLGVKHTFFVYNEEELSLKERLFEVDDEMRFEKIEYPLAHNIIYAGHDYALEYDIKPAAEFAITKNILEEDNDDIELIEIEVGDEDGKPVLIVQQAGQHADALLKLKKNAGEGNYEYIVGDEDLDDEDLNEDEYDSLDDYKDGEINPYSACNIRSLDLLDKEKVEKRSRPEMLSLEIEIYLRLLLKEKQNYIYEEGPEYNWVEGSLEYPASIDEAGIRQYRKGIDDLKTIEATGINVVNALNDLFQIIIEKYPSNLLLASTFHLQEIMAPNVKLHNTTLAILKSFGNENSFAVLTLAIYALIKNEDAGQYSYIFGQEDIYKAFPKVTNFSAIELLLFFLIKVILFTRENNLEKALKYYQLVTAINISNWVLLPVQIEFLAFLDKNLNEGIGSETIGKFSSSQ